MGQDRDRARQRTLVRRQPPGRRRRRPRRARAASGATISAGIEDIAPTILYLMGEPVPLDLEGRVLEEAISPPTPRKNPPSTGTLGRRGGQAETYSGEEAAVEGGSAGSATSSRRPESLSARRLLEDERPQVANKRSSILTAAGAAPSAAIAEPSRPDPRRTGRALPPRAGASGSWWSSTASPWRASRGTTTGRLPFASDESMEPTPACVTTTRAPRIGRHELVEGQVVDAGRARRAHGRRPMLDEQLLIGRNVSSARRSRSKVASFVPTVTKIIARRTRCPRYRDPGRRFASSGHWT